MRPRCVRMSVGLLIAVLAASLFEACSSSETSVATAPSSSSRCQINVSAPSSSFNAAGGSGTVGVSTERDCTWTVTTDVGWVSITGNRDGQGDASVAYTVAPNPAPAPRSGSIAIGSSRVQLNQAAAPCTYSLSKAGDSIGAAGGRLSFDVATLTGCGWSAGTDAAWLTIVSGQSGNGNATVTVAVAANAGGVRVGRVSAGGQTYTVTQSAAAATPDPAPTPTPTPPPPPPSGETVHIKGTAIMVGGTCPDVTFFVLFQRIVTDGNTDYNKKNDCSDLTTGRDVDVEGIDNGSFVLATKISIGGKDMTSGEQ
jgi:all-beta uncharacterized protein